MLLLSLLRYDTGLSIPYVGLGFGCSADFMCSASCLQVPFRHCQKSFSALCYCFLLHPHSSSVMLVGMSGVPVVHRPICASEVLV